ncbi:aspartate/glutamate racemase family protein [Brasilonema sp. CT11]|nr:aspartate/glutamate racemase family protein [Brasilonema sp. CT11]
MIQSINYACFTEVQPALAALQGHRQQLLAFALAKKLRGETIADQDYPTEVISLNPQSTQASPLLLIGGMGPLAGLGAFERACQRFQNSRQIILFQACFIPDRTSAIGQVRASYQENYTLQLLINKLVFAIRTATQYVRSNHSFIQVIILCNTAHHVLPQVIEQFRQHHPDIALKWISLIEATVEYAKMRNFHRLLVLSTDATRIEHLYTRPLQAVGLNCVELNDTLQAILMQSIYQGVKSFDCNLACHMGEYFFTELLKVQPEVDCIIAGCSEIPYLMEWLKASGSMSLKRFLQNVDLLDPIKITLETSVL